MSVKMYDNIEDIEHYRLRIPLSGGKAGKGHAKTSNVQVLNTKKGTLEKLFSFKTGDYLLKLKALNKAREYCLTTLGNKVVSQ